MMSTTDEVTFLRYVLETGTLDVGIRKPVTVSG